MAKDTPLAKADLGRVRPPTLRTTASLAQSALLPGGELRTLVRPASSVGTPIVSGLYMGDDKIGFYNAAGAGGWTAYIDNYGNFQFGSSSQYIAFDGTDVTLQSVVLNQYNGATLILTLDTDGIRITPEASPTTSTKVKFQAVGDGTAIGTIYANRDAVTPANDTLYFERMAHDGSGSVNRIALLSARIETTKPIYPGNATVAQSSHYVAGDTDGIGIDTTNPAYLLDVNGAGRFSGGINVGTETGAGTGDIKASGAVTITGNLTVDTTTLVVSATGNKVGIGTNDTAATLGVNGKAVIGAMDAWSTDDPAQLVVKDATSGTTIGNSDIIRVVGQNSAAGDCQEIGFIGWTGDGYTPWATIGTVIVSNTGYKTAAITFCTRTATDNTAPTERMRINPDGGVTIGSPTGGSKGAGTLNAVGVYDDDVLLTDALWDLHYDGRIRPEDEPVWQDARLLSIAETDAYTREWRHLPDFPSRADWQGAPSSLGQLVNALWATVERQQIHIYDLQAQIERLSTCPA